MIESPVSGINRRQPLLTPEKKEKTNRIGEVAGGTAAECAVVCCCCPCALMYLLIIAVYKVPTGICKRAWRKRKRKRQLKKKNALLVKEKRESASIEKQSYYDDDDDEMDGDEDEGVVVDEIFEHEMWDRFYGTGFWRTPSQRDD